MRTYTKEDKEIFLVRDEKIEVISLFRFDSETHQKVFDEELDDTAIKKAFDIYRTQNKIITPRELKDIREKYSLSQRAFATITGLGEATIIRYEKGVLPTKSNSNFLKDLKTNVSRMEQLFEAKKEELDEKTQKKFIESMLEFKKHDKNLYIDIFKALFDDSVENIYNGFKKFNLEKVIQVISYFANNHEYLSKTKLNKLLFYLDFSYFNHYTTSLTGITYIHDYYGPVPDKMDILYGLLAELDEIEWVPFSNGSGEYVKASASYNDLSNLEKDILENILNKFKTDTANSISDKSHEEKAWKETALKETISYEYASELIYNV